MTAAVEAIYKDGLLRPLQPLALPEHARVRIFIETMDDDPERAAWLEQSAHRLREVWENDDVFNDLLP
jgi:predicted DNA-binding antitoxin AbrB/MazE fold protein